jgi:hypothetical protein
MYDRKLRLVEDKCLAEVTKLRDKAQNDNHDMQTTLERVRDLKFAKISDDLLAGVSEC